MNIINLPPNQCDLLLSQYNRTYKTNFKRCGDWIVTINDPANDTVTMKCPIQNIGSETTLMILQITFPVAKLSLLPLFTVLDAIASSSTVRSVVYCSFAILFGAQFFPFPTPLSFASFLICLVWAISLIAPLSFFQNVTSQGQANNSKSRN